MYQDSSLPWEEREESIDPSVGRGLRGGGCHWLVWVISEDEKEEEEEKYFDCDAGKQLAIGALFEQFIDELRRFSDLLDVAIDAVIEVI